MAIAATVLTTGGSSSGSSTYTTASISPTGNSLILIAVDVGDVAPTTPTVSGNGITYSLIDTIQYDTSGFQRWLFLFRGMAPSPASGTVSIAFGSTKNWCNWQITEFSNVNTSGTNGSGAIAQNQTNSGDSTTFSVTLSSFSSFKNRPYVAFSHDGQYSVTPKTNWTELGEVNSSNDLTLETEWRSDMADTDCAASISTARVWGGIGVEIKISSTIFKKTYSNVITITDSKTVIYP